MCEEYLDKRKIVTSLKKNNNKTGSVLFLLNTYLNDSGWGFLKLDFIINLYVQYTHQIHTKSFEMM